MTDARFAAREAAADYLERHDYLRAVDIRAGKLDTHGAVVAFERAILAAEQRVLVRVRVLEARNAELEKIANEAIAEARKANDILLALKEVERQQP